MFYLAVFTVIVLFSVVTITDYQKKYEHFLFFLLFIMFWLISGLRYETGGDWNNYTKLFDRIPSIDEIMFKKKYNEFAGLPVEIGYRTLCSLVKTITNNIQVIFFIISFCNSVLLFNSVKRYIPYPIVALMVYFSTLYFLLDMMYMRQCCAVMIFLYSIRFIKKRQGLRYFICCLLAISFHYSAILLLPLYFILNQKFSSLFVVVFVVVGLVIYFLKITWVSNVAIFLVDKFTGNPYISRLITYLTSSNFNIRRSVSIGFLFYFFVLFFVLLKRAEIEKSNYFNIFFNLFLINVFVNFYAAELFELSNRIKCYFLIANIGILPYILYSYKSKYERLSLFSIITVFSLIFGNSIFFESPVALSYNPYQNYIFYKALDLKSTGAHRLVEGDKNSKRQRKK